LAFVQAKPKVKSKLEDIPVVCHYLDVFVEAMGLPPVTTHFLFLYKIESPQWHDE
jgi:hypothetical protein